MRRASACQASPIDLCRVVLWSFLCILVTQTRVDPDLWGHLRFGLDMLATKSIHSVDPYSFTADRPWINHEWLAELLMGMAYSALGAPGLILLKLGVIATIAIIIWKVATEEGARPIARDLLIGLVIFATYTRTQVIRPQMFSVAIFCFVLYLFREVNKGRSRALLAIPLCFLVWANVHGGWIVGLGALGVWAVGHLLQSTDRREAVPIVAVVAVSFLATLVNPYGVGLWQFLLETVRLERPDITDWKPLLELPVGVLVFESLLPLAATAGLFKGRSYRGVPARDFAVVALLVFATFRIGRVDAFLQLAIAILFAPQIISLLHGLDVNLRASFQRRSAPVAIIGVALIAYVFVMGLDNLRAIRVGGHWIPDRTAALLLRDTRPGARVLTWFDWGEYALWQLSPVGIRVSMDGRRETVYSAQVIKDHFRFYEGRPEMVDYPDRIGADHIWLPSHFPVIERLTNAGWTKVLDTGKSVVLARRGGPIAYRTEHTPGPNVFPWP